MFAFQNDNALVITSCNYFYLVTLHIVCARSTMNFSYHTGHVISDHAHKTHPSDCFKCCERCSGWQAEQFCQPTSLGNDKDKMEERSSGSICYNYHAPVTNNYYTLPTTATPTCSSNSSSSSDSDSNDERETPLLIHPHSVQMWKQTVI